MVKKMFHNIAVNKTFHLFIYLFILVIFLEITLFNYKHWFSRGYEEIDASNYITEYGSGITMENGLYRITDTNLSYIRFQGMNFHIENIFLDAYSQTDKTINIHLFANDEAYCDPIDIGYSTTENSNSLTKYLDLHLNGDTDEVLVYFIDNNRLININSIAFNETVPFNISLFRVFILMLIGTFFILFHPKSFLYDIKLFCLGKKQYGIIVLFIVPVILTCLFIGNIIYPDIAISEQTKLGMTCVEEYVELADALISGQLELKRTPPNALALVENPYDPIDRAKTLDAVNETYSWDYAYFEGKYYCYFGVVPAILFYVPYKLITGNDLKTWDLTTLCGIFYCIVCFYFLYQLYKKYFPNICLGTYLLTGYFLCFSSSIVYLLYAGIVYSVPIITGMLFGLLGLSLWLSASRDGKIIKWRIILGSLCIALIIGCRPQLVLIFLMAIPIFWNETIKERHFFSKKGLYNTVLIMVPFVVIGIMIMLYNWARFHSPFDFGANYNLTGNDMHRGWVWERIPLGVFTYIFEPLTVSAAFPFLQLSSIANDYLGSTIYEIPMGGLLAYNSLMIFNIFVFKYRKQLFSKTAFMLAVLPSVIGFIIMILDMEMSGLTQRYLSDFSWLFAITTVIMIPIMEQNVDKKCRQLLRSFRNLLVVGVFACILLNCWSIFIDGRYYMLKDCNPQFYYAVKCMLPFY